MIDKLYFLLKQCKAKNIYFFDADPEKVKGKSFGDENIFVCGINKKLDEDEQVITLLHERLHDHPRFKKYEPLLHRTSTKIMTKKVEKEINEIAKNIYQNSSHVRNYLLKQIRLANPRIISLEESFGYSINFLMENT